MSAPALAEPLHVLIPHRYAQPPTTAQCEAATNRACYSPAQFQQAYNMKPLYQVGLTGKGKTIVLVDAFGSPTIESDLATFDQETGLPAPPSFQIIQPDGPVPSYNPSTPDMTSWATETSLDVEYSHAMAPGANVLLVETPVDETEGVQGFPQIVQAENYVINHDLGDVISQSFGATEETFPSPQAIFALRGAIKNAAAHRVTVLGSSGDAGASGNELDLTDFYPFRVNSWPSTDPLVTSVGGTQLHLDQNGFRTAPDNVWNDTALFGSPAASGGGVSAVFGRPFYQDGVRRVVDSARGTPDVSMSAAANGGASVYMSFAGLTPAGPGWYTIGGTSEASPLFSAIVAIGDQAAGHRLGLLNPGLYALGDGPGSGIVDITRGNNTVTFTQTDTAAPDYNKTYTVRGYRAVRGYDLASGLGTANGARLVSDLAASGRP
ncbi:MAG: S53 family peptidase [Solirubrobacterales bacterium]|nr:S53 family peptidase [Solirubrobacterales bacterium]